MFALEFKTGNAAFGECDDEMRAEIARILKSIAYEVDHGGDLGDVRFVRDYNGNKIGEFKLLGRHGIGRDK